MLNRSWSDMNHTFTDLVARSAPPKRRQQAHRPPTTTPMRPPARHQPEAATVAPTRHKAINAAPARARPMAQSLPLPVRQTPPPRVKQTPPKVKPAPAVKTVGDEPNPVGSQLRSIERTLSVSACMRSWTIDRATNACMVNRRCDVEVAS